MSIRKQLRLGLIGYGEVGSALGNGLKAEGLREVTSYDKYAFDGPFATLIQRRAAEVDLPLVRSPGEHQQLFDGAVDRSRLA